MYSLWEWANIWYGNRCDYILGEILLFVEDTVTSNGGMRSCANCPNGTVPDVSGFDCVGETSTFNTVSKNYWNCVVTMTTTTG